MEDSGQFRTSLNGFNKQDVLRYLEELNSREYSELQMTKKRLEASEREAGSLRDTLQEALHRAEQAETDVATLQSAIDEYVQTARERSAENEELIQLRREKQMWRVKESSLLRSGANAAALQQEVENLREQLSRSGDADKLREQLDAAREKNERYRALVDNMSRFVAEMRRMEQEMLKACHGQSEEKLQDLYELMNAWEKQAVETKQQLQSVRNALQEKFLDTDRRITELVEGLDTTAGG